jgi:hypothetical protein
MFLPTFEPGTSRIQIQSFVDMPLRSVKFRKNKKGHFLKKTASGDTLTHFAEEI